MESWTRRQEGRTEEEIKRDKTRLRGPKVVVVGRFRRRSAATATASKIAMALAIRATAFARTPRGGTASISILSFSLSLSIVRWRKVKFKAGETLQREKRPSSFSAPTPLSFSWSQSNAWIERGVVEGREHLTQPFLSLNHPLEHISNRERRALSRSLVLTHIQLAAKLELLACLSSPF